MAESALSFVERLRAALDRAEEIARSAALRSPAPWRLDGDPWAVPGSGMVDAKGVGVAVAIGSYVADHILATDPAHVLRTVAAHRKIIDEHAILVLTYWPTAMCAVCADSDADVDADPMGRPWMPNQAYPCTTLQALAAVYFPEAEQ